MLKAYLLHTATSRPYLSIGTDPVEASVPIIKLLNCKLEDISVSGSWPIDQPIDIGKLWPLFTNNPPQHFLD